MLHRWMRGASDFLEAPAFFLHPLVLQGEIGYKRVCRRLFDIVKKTLAGVGLVCNGAHISKGETDMTYAVQFEDAARFCVSFFDSRAEAAQHFRRFRNSGNYTRVTFDAGRSDWSVQPIVVWTPHTGTIYRSTHA